MTLRSKLKFIFGALLTLVGIIAAGSIFQAIYRMLQDNYTSYQVIIYSILTLIALLVVNRIFGIVDLKLAFQRFGVKVKKKGK